MAEESKVGKVEKSAADPRMIPEWHQFYRNQPVEGMPWYFEALDPDLEGALSRHGVTSGKAVDIGAGPGTQAMALAERGYHVTGTDLAEAAVEGAAAKARERGLAVEFKVDDILHTGLGGPFDFAFDRGCFHVLPVSARADYVRIVAGLLRPGGYLFLKAFSRLQPGEIGPFRFSPDEIKSIFGGAFEILSIDETVYQGTFTPLPRALFSVLKRA
jgi:2-polyprenyl-3-methyl-5-hydroxy-6-metoxy-1,4-benzoquinol methylase